MVSAESVATAAVTGTVVFVVFVVVIVVFVVFVVVIVVFVVFVVVMVLVVVTVVVVMGTTAVRSTTNRSALVVTPCCTPTYNCVVCNNPQKHSVIH